MSIGVSIFLIAVGAIMHFAVTAKVGGLSISTAGVILMLVGGLGLVISFIMLGMNGGFNGGRRTTIVREETRPIVNDGRTTVTRDDVR
jgi:hypothetical protein